MFIIHLVTVSSDLLLAMVSNNNGKYKHNKHLSRQKTLQAAEAPKSKTLILYNNQQPVFRTHRHTAVLTTMVTASGSHITPLEKARMILMTEKSNKD